MSLDPKARELLAMVYRVNAPRFHELSVSQARHATQKLMFAFRPEAPAVASTTEVPIPRPDGSVLFARLYRPLGCHASEDLGLLIYFHGGGWCTGDLPGYDVLCRELANQSGAAVLSVDYRLAPEHRFPAAVHDASLAFEWSTENASLLGVDAERIALGGDSAGGNLAIVAALEARDRAARMPRALALIYPSTQIHSERSSRETFADGYFLDRESLRWFYEHYFADPAQAHSWQASPMLAASLAGLPPAILITAGCDPLTDDCVAFAERMVADGGLVVRHHFEGMVHGFLPLGKFFAQANEAVRCVSSYLREALQAS
ncbi:MAG: alpha/beta hydrolase [Rhodocyclaceae bacterium]|nr:alpha/beta hydrolase [Rhodocyclaceae bacterium]MCW5616240.1 alpha/beta hydrolase [Rhodocyclaceae bacterium]